MAEILLVHWNVDEAARRIETLRRAGHDVALGAVDGAGLRKLKNQPPAAVVIDLGRLPSHGREVARALQETRATRQIPLVFVEGEPARVAALAAELPHATYTTWRRIRGALKAALAAPPAAPAAPSTKPSAKSAAKSAAKPSAKSAAGPAARSAAKPSARSGGQPAPSPAGYSGTPLIKKLGIADDTVLALIDAPGGFGATLGPLPDSVRVIDRARGRADLTVWFVTSRRALDSGIAAMNRFVADSHLWIAWPKKSSGMASDLVEDLVRAAGLAHDLVDYKVCAIDATWSGLKFARRKKK